MKNSGVFPEAKKPAKISNLDVLNAMLYLAENGCKWRGLPKEYGDWPIIYVRVNRWAKKGSVIQIKVNVVSLDSTSIKVHPDGTGALKKWAPVYRKNTGGMEHQA